MRLIRSAALLAALATIPLAPPGALAHHGWGSYDSSKVLSMAGPIVEASYQYPHAHLVIEHEGERWEVVLAPPSRMQQRGIAADDLKPGVAVTVEGYPSKVKPHAMRAERITLDGRTVELR